MKWERVREVLLPLAVIWTVCPAGLGAMILTAKIFGWAAPFIICIGAGIASAGAILIGDRIYKRRRG